MKKIYSRLSLLMFASVLQYTLSAQCGSPVVNGTASNMFTLIRNGNHPISVDKTLNMVVFAHRNDAGTFGGNSGQIRYDISTNAGTTWTLNQGPINSASVNFARYPNAQIYNPANNTNTANAYVAYMAPTINSSSAWNGIVTGVSQINTTTYTESQNQNGIGTSMIPHSMVKGAPGVMWGVEYLPTYLGYNIYRGQWSTTANDFVWTINTVINPPFNTGFSTFPTITDYNIAFDPSGLIGYFSFLGHVTPGPSNYGLYPVLYKTIDGGTTWTGPIQVDLTKLGCITTNTSNGVPSTNTEHDLIVDVNGNPHIITTVGTANNYAFNYGVWHHMYDITLKNGMWVGYDLGNVNGSPQTFGMSPDVAVQMQAPQASRTADGTKVFFTWTDNSTYTMGQANATPNLFGKAFNVSNGNWTQTKDFTSCNTSLNGIIMFPHLAPEVLEPATNVFKMAAVYGEPSQSNNLLVAANFRFIDNLTFASTEFTVAVPQATVNITGGSNIIFCPNSTVMVNVANAGEVLWSNGSTLIPMPITTSSISVYTVTAQVACLIGTTSISVQNLTVNAGASTPTICPGGPANFTVVGNALSYSWSPGTSTGTNVTLNPTNTTVTVTAMGSASCTVNNTVSINILPKPTIAISGNTFACSASPTVNLTASGGATYLWNNNTTGSTYTGNASPTITVIGTGANSCTNIATISTVVYPTPTVSASGTQSAICNGQSLNLTASGAATYSWNGVAGGSTNFVSPTSTSIYTVTGSSTQKCEATATIQIVVFALPSLTVTPSRPFVCKGEKVTLTATGADNYTWSPTGSISSSIILNATNAQTYNYVINMLNTTGCAGTATFSIAVSACSGIGELNGAALQVAIYPNPNNGTFIIKTQSNIDLSFVNELGQVLKNISLTEGNNNQVLVSDLPSGIYFITGKNDHGIIKQKVVINK